MNRISSGYARTATPRRGRGSRRAHLERVEVAGLNVDMSADVGDGRHGRRAARQHSLAVRRVFVVVRQTAVAHVVVRVFRPRAAAAVRAVPATHHRSASRASSFGRAATLAPRNSNLRMRAVYEALHGERHEAARAYKQRALHGADDRERPARGT